MAELVMTEEGSTPATPASTKWKVYFKSTGLYILEDTGTEVGPLVKGASGTYTPSLTNTTNVAASTVSQAFNYMRVGNFVMVSGGITVDPTATGNTVIKLSLPIASNFTAGFDLTGNGTSQLSNMVGNLQADATNDLAQLTFQASVATSEAWRVMFMYEVK
jgi:hypothetical protein